MTTYNPNTVVFDYTTYRLHRVEPGSVRYDSDGHYTLHGNRDDFHGKYMHGFAHTACGERAYGTIGPARVTRYPVNCEGCCTEQGESL